MALSAGVVPHNIARVSAALAGAGAWDAAPVEFAASGATRMTLHFNYTRGGVGGAFDFRIDVSAYSVAALVPAGGAEWVQGAGYALGVIAAGADTQGRSQRTHTTYQATGAAAESFIHGPLVLSQFERVRIVARESGAAGTPGTLQIEALLE